MLVDPARARDVPGNAASSRGVFRADATIRIESEVAGAGWRSCVSGASALDCIRSLRQPSRSPDCPGNELAFLTYFTALRLIRIRSPMYGSCSITREV